jgi:hypothetical protein
MSKAASESRDSNEDQLHSEQNLFFENLPSLLGVEATASLLNFSVATIYDWRYRGKQKKVPRDLFLKFNRKLFIKTEVLKRWIISQNSSY